MPDTRPVHLIVIDGWHPGLLAAERARLPALSHLVRHGVLDEGCISTFPTVTPTALATLVTGGGPDWHGIPGIMWYHRGEDRYVHYWPSPQKLAAGTMRQVVEDIVHHLNHSHLKAPSTVFERLEDAGWRCGHVNYPVGRGRTLHRARLPFLLAQLLGTRELAVPGPRHVYLGDLIRPEGFWPSGVFGRYGIVDARAAAYGHAMIRRWRPDFSLIYLNEHDMHSHRAGPMGCGRSLRAVDAAVGHLLDAYGGWAAAVREARWILVGDHAQSAIGGVPGHAVRVFRQFPGFSVAPLARGGLWRDGHDLAVAPNDRAMLLTVRDPARRPELVAELAAWPCVQQLAWREAGWDHVLDPGAGAHLAWRPGQAWHDALGQGWELVGDLAALELHVTAPGMLGWGSYPDALGRLMASLSSGVDLVVTARRGYEFTTGVTMGRGNHGSLEREDSLVPLLTVGLPPVPRPARTLDVAGLILRAFGVTTPAGTPQPTCHRG